MGPWFGETHNVSGGCLARVGVGIAACSSLIYEEDPHASTCNLQLLTTCPTRVAFASVGAKSYYALHEHTSTMGR